MTIVRLARRAMVTLFEVTVVAGDERAGRAACEAALDEIERVEREISLFLPTSEISRINELAAGTPVAVAPRLYELLRTARELSRQTGGAFDVTVGSLMAARGFRVRATRSAEQALASAGWRHLYLEGGAVRLAGVDTRLDLGAIGKGYALDRAARRLRGMGIDDAFLHGGWSTMYALGSAPVSDEWGEGRGAGRGAGRGDRRSDGWAVGLVEPARPERRFGSITLRDRALSVSAADGRTAGEAATPRSHVVDPRSGGEPRRAVAWALAADAATADALSTAFLLEPAAEIEALCRRRGWGAVLLDPEPRTFGVEMDRLDESRGASPLSRREFLSRTAAAAAAFAIGLPERSAARAPSGGEIAVGVIGLGERGTRLLAQLARIDGVRIRAVCDLREAALDEALAITGRNVETYLDHRHLLDVERLDGLVVATPTDTHRPICLDAIDVGTGVFCEAPLASSIEDCRALAVAAEASEAIFQVGHQRRWNRLYPHALSHIRSGSIGDLVKIDAQWHRRTPWGRPGAPSEAGGQLDWRLSRARSGGLLLERGSHVFDLANWYLDATPERVTGFGSTRQWRDGRDIDDTVQVLLLYPGGVQLSFAATLVASYGEEREHLYGSAGTILLLGRSKGLLFKEPDSVSAGWETFAREELLGERRGIVLDPEATRYAADESEPGVGPVDSPVDSPADSPADSGDLHAELAAFVDSLGGGEPPRCGARQGAIAAITALVALRAIRGGGVVDYAPGDFAL